ncbi:ABC transporter ATP-binding protein [Thermoproteus tenax]|uniref:ABC-type sugar transport system, ATPase component n=1 Tax=Thermoproteus tenax (strain ATCC 35583 / DSM 2078 / JCM 9277 / NBRC 100435 / Kra 1) TaxID=768679 RepID=G4RM98_THETK|nr:ABC transporter ATP-binding protein [Thermoproteus tenax]CCC80729.1 ABC-type sugar transport system, ATPase component [Thermoproteus tenax Kra 1]
MLLLKNIKKSFKGFTIKIDELTVPDKSYVVVLGPSGSGKTTLLRIIAGLERPDEGAIYLDGRDITNLPVWERDIGIVFQNYALYPHLTVYDNIAMPLKNRGFDKRQIQERIERIARILNIQDQLHKYPSQLSGGQQQRVAIARALVKEPKILLLDEPLSNLDARLRLEVRGFLKELQKELGTTVLHVTHDQEEAMALGDILVVINNGKIEQVGPPAELYSRPRSVFVFNFLGLSNLLPSEALGMGEGKRVGFRPEHVVIGDGPLRGRVLREEYLGPYKIVELDFNGHRIKARVPPTASYKVGEIVDFSIKETILFD